MKPSQVDSHQRSHDIARLSADEALVESYIVHVLQARHCAIGKLPRTPRDLPYARFAGRLPAGQGAHQLFVPGEYVAALLRKKTGFSRAESYLTQMLALYRQALGPELELTVWDFDGALPHELLDKLAERIGQPIRRLESAGRQDMARALWRLVREQEGPFRHWLLDAWKQLALALPELAEPAVVAPATSLGQSPD